MTNLAIDLPIQNEEELRNFILWAWGVRIADKKICDAHQTPWDAFCYAYFGKGPVCVWKASRGFGGKSFLLALLGLTEACTLGDARGANVNILGGSGEQSENVHGYMQHFWDWDTSPKHLLSDSGSKRETRITFGNRIKALAASQKSVRGPHPQRLRLDEIDEMDISILDAALGQPMGSDGVSAQTVLSSTHQNADGTMTAILKRAKEKGWPVFEWCWRESLEPHGWLAEREIIEKKATVPQAMWDTEYELQDPNPSARAIQTECVEAMFDPALGQFDGRMGELITLEPPVKGASYLHGCDWAKDIDFTVIPTFRYDIKPWKLIAFERSGRLPWPVMVKKFNDRVALYPGKAAHDATGIGNVVADYLTVKATDVLMVGRNRSDMLSEYISAIEQGRFVAPRIEFMYGEHKYASRDDVYGSGHLPDSISAGCLALWAKTHGGGVPFG